MAIIKDKNHKDNYTVIKNNIFREKGLSLKAKGLLALVISLKDDWQFNIEGLSKLSSDKKYSVETALKELEKYGYLKREKIRDKGKFSVEYTFYEVPYTQTATEKSKRLKSRGRQS